MKIAKFISIIALAATASTCSSGGKDINDDPNAGTQGQQYAKLIQRPSLEEIKTQYQLTLSEIRKMTVSEFGLPAWEAPPEDPIGGAGCGFNFPDVNLPDGQTLTIDGGYSRANIPDARWADAVAKVGEIAKKYGFTQSQFFRTHPGDNDARYFTPFGDRLDFGTEKNTVLGISSDCHLSSEARQRGGPAKA
jgi:hypothetical protein